MPGTDLCFFCAIAVHFHKTVYADGSKSFAFQYHTSINLNAAEGQDVDLCFVGGKENILVAFEWSKFFFCYQELLRFLKLFFASDKNGKVGIFCCAKVFILFGIPSVSCQCPMR